MTDDLSKRGGTIASLPVEQVPGRAPDKARYIVDDRCGCVAVRDSTMIDPDRPGLHGDEDDCVRFWMKERVKVKCECCGNVSEQWKTDSHVDEANELAAKLNAADNQSVPRDGLTMRLSTTGGGVVRAW